MKVDIQARDHLPVMLTLTYLRLGTPQYWLRLPNKYYYEQIFIWR